MAASSIPNEIATESDVSMVLNTLMYVNDFTSDSNNGSVCELLDDMGTRYNDFNAEQKASYDAVFQYVYGKEPEITVTTDDNGHMI
jgi:hypothetical protein